MKTFCSRTIRLNKVMVKLILVKQKEQTYYRFVIANQRVARNRYKSQQIYLTETATPLGTYFLHLRAALDREKHPVLIADLMSGRILSINLLAFELFKIDAVGFQIIDFAADVEMYERINQQLQHIGKAHQTILLQDADGDLMECEIDAEIAPYYPRWAIFHLNTTQQAVIRPSPYHSQLGF